MMFDLTVPALTWEMLSMALLIFMLRIIDVSLGTLRMIMITRGKRLWATLLGFVEVTIWVVAVSQVLTNLDNIWYVLGYSSGFAAGTLLGMWLEDKLAIGIVELSVISTERGAEIVRGIRSAGYGATQLQAQGLSGSVSRTDVVVERKHLEEVISLVNAIDPVCLLSVRDERRVIRGTLDPGNRAKLRLLQKPVTWTFASDELRFLQRVPVALIDKVHGTFQQIRNPGKNCARSDSGP